MATRQQILDRINDNPAGFSPAEIANAIKSRDHEFVVADLYALRSYSAEKIDKVRTILTDFENTKFNEAVEGGAPDDLRSFITEFGNGRNVEKAESLLKNMDDETWSDISDSQQKSDFEQYKSNFPEGNHIGKCDEILEDFDWYIAKKDDTIEGYQNYLDNHPGQRDDEVKNKIKYFEETQIWKNCEAKGTDGYKEYLIQYPNGRYASEAKIRISNVSQKDKFLNALRQNKNENDISAIQRAVRENKIQWSDVEEIFGEAIAGMIKKYEDTPALPNSEIPTQLSGKGTEVYFWGIRGSGKTCALGTILSYINKKGLYSQEDCKGAKYRDALKSLFKQNDSLCILPPATDEEQIHEMALSLKNPDKEKNPKNLKTPFTFIDLPGELIHRAYELQGRPKVEVEDILKKDNTSGDNHFKNFNTLLTYLRNQNRPKIHFFIFEYGSHEKAIEINGLNVSIPDCLNALMSLLQQLKVFSKSTVGIYLLMTKADRLLCEKEDRPEKAEEYFNEHFLSFKNQLEDICKGSYIGDFCGITFSIGDVYAQQICKFDGADTEKLLQKLFLKSKPENDNWLMRWLKG